MNIRRKSGLTVLCILGFFSQAYATPLIDFASDNSSFVWFGNNLGCGAGCTLGYEFNVSSSVTIDGLGIFDADGDGLNNTHEVAIWTSGGVLLASTSVLVGTVGTDASASGAGSFAYADIASLALGAGDYVVGALFEVGHTDRVVFGATGIFSNDAGVSFTERRFINSGALTLPTGGTGSGGMDRYFGPGLRITPDTDGDGVPDGDDFCPDNTVIPEGVPTMGDLNPNHWALTVTGNGFDFDTVLKGKGRGPNRSYTIEDTAGCSCEQIIEIQGLGDGHSKYGCSISAMDDWIDFVNPM